jgi:hypothetical protein
MGLIKSFEFFRISTRIRMMDPGQLSVSRLYFGRVPVGEQFFDLEFEEFQGSPFLFGKPRPLFFIRPDGLHRNVFVVILLEKEEGGVALGASAVDHAVPFFRRLEHQVLEILCRLFACRPFVQKPGNFFGPNREHIEDHVIFGEGEGCIPRIKHPEQAL